MQNYDVQVLGRESVQSEDHFAQKGERKKPLYRAIILCVLGVVCMVVARQYEQFFSFLHSLGLLCFFWSGDAFFRWFQQGRSLTKDFELEEGWAMLRKAVKDDRSLWRWLFNAGFVFGFMAFLSAHSTMGSLIGICLLAGAGVLWYFQLRIDPLHVVKHEPKRIGRVFVTQFLDQKTKRQVGATVSVMLDRREYRFDVGSEDNAQEDLKTLRKAC